MSSRDPVRTAWYTHQEQAAQAMRLEARAAAQLATLTTTRPGASILWRRMRDLALRPIVVALIEYRIWLLRRACDHLEAAVRSALHAEARR